MFPQYQAPPPNFNLKDNIEEKNDKNDDDDDKEKNDDSKDNDDDDEKPPPIANFMPGLNYGIIIIGNFIISKVHQRHFLKEQSMMGNLHMFWFFFNRSIKRYLIILV